MGIFAFRRMREQEATKTVAPAPLKKTKRKPKTKLNGNLDRRNSGGSISEQLHNTV